jgi:glyoxylase-like metal-dependent hydrolase (beta-lactamase superfamily II)
VRDFGAGITAGLWGFSFGGGTAHAYQKSHNAFGSCLRCLCHTNRNGAGAGAAPLFATTKVEGTDNIYIFRYQGHQAMFVVTPAGVIVTDPISYGRPQAAKTYLDEIRKITKAPIKYLIYSHHHYDHIAGGKVFKDEGATVIAHRRAKERLAQLKRLDIVVPDQVVDGKRTIKLGGTTLDLVYTGRNHSTRRL